MLDDPSLLKTEAYVGGRWIGARSGTKFRVLSPNDGASIGQVADLDREDVRLAVSAAQEAQKSWAALTAKRRGEILRSWYDLIIEHREDLARLMTWEMGKPVTESRGEVTYAAAFVDWFAEEGKRAYGEVIPTYDASKRLIVLRQPIGVVGAITPWNFPLSMVTKKAAPALAAGCTVVLKPSSAAPLSALAVAELADRASIPSGVLNVVPSTASSDVGNEFGSNPAIRKISFTGSTAVGKTLMAQAAEGVKGVSLELGGNSPFLVFDDADLDAAVDGAIAAKFRNSGQTCVSANRIYVQDTVYRQFSEKFANAVRHLRIGPGLDEETVVGPLVNQSALSKVESLVEEARLQGATVLTGGSRHELGGTFFDVTVLGGVRQDMRVGREEIFGPVAPLLSFSEDEEGVTLANDTPYGLAAYFYCRDVSRVWKILEGLEYGLVGVNTGLMSTEIAPFGGFKESGVGREGGHVGLEEFMETKYVAMGGI